LFLCTKRAYLVYVYLCDLRRRKIIPFLLVFLSFFDETPIVFEPYFTSALLILDALNTDQLNGTHWHHC